MAASVLLLGRNPFDVGALAQAGYDVILPTGSLGLDEVRDTLRALLDVEGVAVGPNAATEPAALVACGVAGQIGVPVAPVEWWTTHRVGGEDRG
jgi:hypothetical protein